VLVISLGALWAAEIIGMGVVLGLVASDGVGGKDVRSPLTNQPLMLIM
jgi:hypothetical protein